MTSSDFAQAAADAIAGLGDASPADARRVLQEYNAMDQIAAVASLAVTAKTVGSAGAVRIFGPFRFAFDTPNLNQGVEFYTPNVGDILVDAFVQFPVPFNGTTPKFDCIDIYGDTNGAFYNQKAPVDATLATFPGSAALLLFGRVTAASASSLSTALLSYVTASGSPHDFAPFQAKVNQPTPWKLWVSSSGQSGGAATGATQGEGDLYLVTATPTLPADAA